jgi:citrate synthase
MSKKTVTITDNRTGKQYDFPIIDGTKGPSAIDIASLYKQMGLFTYDPSYASTASCSSGITFLDGEKGILKYQGYDIEDLAKNHNYLDVCHLLLNGNLPNKQEKTDFDIELRHRAYLQKKMENLFESFRYDAHPMAKMAASIAAMSSFYLNHESIETNEEYLIMAKRLIAKMPTLAAFSYRYSAGVPLVYPDNERYYTENFLYMMRAYPNFKFRHKEYGQEEIKPIEVKALDAIFILHADHEQNASASTVRMVASTMAHPYAAISAGVSALWGKSHGGANEIATRQLTEIGNVKNVQKYIDKAKDKNDPFKLMGFGHRVYKSYDPRAKILKSLKDDLLKELNINDPLIEVAEELERVALNDEYFIQRGLYPNVDFYSGFLLRALQIPLNMFTPIFVIGRTVGWLAQLIELRQSENLRIARPRQIYIGK